MTPNQNPTPNDQTTRPLPYALPVLATPRPMAVTVLAIIGVVMGAFGAISGGFSLVINLVIHAHGGHNPYNLRLPAVSPTMMWYNITASAVGISLAIALLIGSIGSFKLFRGTRIIMLVWACLYAIWSIVRLWLSITVITPHFLKQMAASQLAQGQTVNPALNRKIAIGGAIVTFGLFILPALFVLLFFTRSKIKAAFEARMSEV